MKKYCKSSNIAVKPDMQLESKKILAADDEVDDTFDDKLNKVEDDFNYILDGINQLDMVQGNEILNSLNETMQDYIQQIAEQLS